MEKICIFFTLLIGLAQAGSDEFVQFLNSQYSDISGNMIPLYTLTKEIFWMESLETNTIQATLLLNNTYKGLGFHVFDVALNDTQFSIVSHQVPTAIHDPLGVNFIQRALLNTLEASEIALEELVVKKMNASDAILYSSSVNIDKIQYNVDVLLFNKTVIEYVATTKVLTVLKTILKESVKYSGIVIAALLGFLTAFSGLYIYYRKNRKVPFIQMRDAQVYSGEKNV